jgi:spore maturation protein CgeB
MLLGDSDAADTMAERGRETILARHTCAHRVNELMQVLEELNEGAALRRPARRSSVAEVL